jgi:hypothetical protein
MLTTWPSSSIGSSVRSSTPSFDASQPTSSSSSPRRVASRHHRSSITRRPVSWTFGWLLRPGIGVGPRAARLISPQTIRHCVNLLRRALGHRDVAARALDLEELGDDRERLHGPVAIGLDRPPEVAAAMEPTADLDHALFTMEHVVDRRGVGEQVELGLELADAWMRPARENEVNDENEPKTAWPLTDARDLDRREAPVGRMAACTSTRRRNGSDVAAIASAQRAARISSAAGLPSFATLVGSATEARGTRCLDTAPY